MVFDIDKLKEAMERAIPGVDEDGTTQPEWAELEVVFDAARLVVAGQPLSFCAFHVAAGDGSLDCWGAGLNGQDDCRMVEGWWMPTGKDET